MVFTKDSFLVKLWLGKVILGDITEDEVPQLFNLKEVVLSLM